jgi:zinc protease
MKHLLLFVFLLSHSLFASELKLPVPQIETLPNGLKLVWFLNDSLPVVDLGILIGAGQRDDLPGKSGTSELMTACLDRGSAGLSAQEIGHAIEMLGASRYASSDDDETTIGLHGLAPDAPALLDLLAKVVIHPDFAAAEVTREHARILDRWRHVADYGESLASLAFSRALSQGTSYLRGGFFSAEEFGGVNRDAVKAFHTKNFTPKNAVLMVVGRVNQVEFRQQILKVFGTPEAWRGDAPVRDYKNYVDPRLALKKEQVLVVDRPGLTQAQVRIGFRAPSIHVPEHYDLVVGNALLGEYFNSRLNSLIRDKLGLTYGISSSFSYGRDIGSFAITSATQNESAGILVKKTLEVLQDLKTGEIPKDEVQMAKEYLVGGFPLATSTLGLVAARWLSGYIYDLGPDYLNEFVPKVSAVTAAGVASAIAKDFDLAHLTIVIAGDADSIEPGLKAAKLGPLKRVSVKDLQ